LRSQFVTSSSKNKIQTLKLHAMPNLETIDTKIFILRNQKVMLDFDLASLYEIETKVLKQAVRRNIDRFPEDFMF
jgi:ABC-type transporter Mla maintaining outer membrane lipid asymmetry ATPase subunit MlaF